MQIVKGGDKIEMKKLFLGLAILAILLLAIPIPVMAYVHKECQNLNINEVELNQRATARSVLGNADAFNFANANIKQPQRNLCSSAGRLSRSVSLEMRGHQTSLT